MGHTNGGIALTADFRESFIEGLSSYLDVEFHVADLSTPWDDLPIASLDLLDVLYVAENCGVAEADLRGCDSLDDLLFHLNQTGCLADMLAALRGEVPAG